MTENNTVERELGWEDEIENDGNANFVTLPAGEYPFTVVGFERGRYEGGDKLPPCNKAIVELEFDGGTCGKTTIKENLFLHTKTEGILCAFFTSIGQRQHGDKLKMNWGTVIGSKGRAKLGIREYQKDGEDRTINQVKRYLEPEGGTCAAPATPAPQQGGSYTPGAF